MRALSLIAIVLFTLLLGTTIAWPRQGVERPVSTTWEYKVVALTIEPEHIEKTFNTLSGEGWEFAGAVRYRKECRTAAFSGALNDKVRPTSYRP